MKRKGKTFVKVKLVLVNIRFRLDISMPVMVTNPSIEFGEWQKSSACPFSLGLIKGPPTHHGRLAIYVGLNRWLGVFVSSSNHTSQKHWTSYGTCSEYKHVNSSSFAMLLLFRFWLCHRHHYIFSTCQRLWLHNLQWECFQTGILQPCKFFQPLPWNMVW